MVAAAHVAFAFADHLGAGLAPGLAWRGEREAQIAVLLFFIVSGYVMVEAQRGRFGTQGARSTFWRRRLIRILPPYWLASALMAGVLIVLFGQSVDPFGFARSLALVPAWPDTGEPRPMVFLWVGWTLTYEMAFYLVFGLFLGLPQRRAILAVTLVLAGAIAAGTWTVPGDPLLFALTRPLSAMFAAGMWLALWRGSGGVLPAPWRWLALAALVPALLLLPEPPQPAASGWDYLAWAGLPALLVALAALGGPLALPRADWINRAGEASYALYLLHLPVAWFWLWLWGRLPGFDAGPWDYLLTALAASIAASWLFARLVEGPLTLALNRRFAPPHRADG